MITNAKEIAITPAREKALEIVNAGYSAIEIEAVIADRISLKNDLLTIRFFDSKKRRTSKITANLKRFEKMGVMGLGKGSALACAYASKILGKRLGLGIALDTSEPKFPVKGVDFFIGTHPLPSEANVKATQKIIAEVKRLREKDLLIVFTCGGGSALATATMAEMEHVILATKELTKAGADIIELNTVRKHLSIFKGGGLAKVAYPAKVISLIVSDILGNDLSMVASGPLVMDKTTKAGAEKILKKYLGKPPLEEELFRSLNETPKDEKFFKNIENILFIRSEDALLAMAEKAKKLGFKAKIESFALKGEAKAILVPLIKKVKGGEAIVAGGESTVTLKNQKSKIKNQNIGKGGRNMEAVLGAILNFRFQISNNLVVVSFASDGRDNTEAAGVIGDVLTLGRAKKLKLDPKTFLRVHDTFHFFKKTGNLIFADKNCFNVSDLMLVLKSANSE